MEVVTLEINKGILQMLVDSGALTTEEFKVKIVDEQSVDYTAFELWKAQKKVSDKEYKKLKQIEFELRHK